jgi:hypothetical protein
MRHVMLFFGMGTALLTSNACRPVPSTRLGDATAIGRMSSGDGSRASGPRSDPADPEY